MTIDKESLWFFAVIIVISAFYLSRDTNLSFIDSLNAVVIGWFWSFVFVGTIIGIVLLVRRARGRAE